MKHYRIRLYLSVGTLIAMLVIALVEIVKVAV